MTKHCRIYRLNLPSEVEVNKYVDVDFVGHVDSGINVTGCLYVMNCRGNPGDIIITFDGKKEWRLPPGFAGGYCPAKNLRKCNTFKFPCLRLKFTKPGKYTLRFGTGYEE